MRRWKSVSKWLLHKFLCKFDYCLMCDLTQIFIFYISCRWKGDPLYDLNFQIIGQIRLSNHQFYLKLIMNREYIHDSTETCFSIRSINRNIILRSEESLTSLLFDFVFVFSLHITGYAYEWPYLSDIAARLCSLAAVGHILLLLQLQAHSTAFIIGLA